MSNERIRELIGIKALSTEDEENLIKGTTESFDAMVDFLRDPETFPNPSINELMTLNWRLIGNKKALVVLDLEGITDKVSFTLISEGTDQLPIFTLPKDFVHLSEEKPSLQLGAMVYYASHAKDYYFGKLAEEIEVAQTLNFVTKRAHAHEAEMLLTLGKMFSQKGEEMTFNDYQKSVLKNYPDGLASLPPGVNYKTPEWN